MTTQDTNEILSLSTIQPVRQIVTIDGVGYEMQRKTDMSLTESLRMQRQQALFQDLDLWNLTTAQEKKVETALDLIVPIILKGLKPATARALSGGQKFEIFTNFLRISGLMPEELLAELEADEETKPETSTGMTSSPDSNGSTERRTRRSGQKSPSLG